MEKRKNFTFEDYLKERLKDLAFKKEWDDSEVEFQLSCRLIEARLAKKMSQQDLAQKIHTSQAAISRIEGMNGNPSLNLLKRIATALDVKLSISLVK